MLAMICSCLPFGLNLVRIDEVLMSRRFDGGFKCARVACWWLVRGGQGEIEVGGFELQPYLIVEVVEVVEAEEVVEVVEVVESWKSSGKKSGES